MTSPISHEELAKLDFSSAVERALWAAYEDGAKQTRRMGGSNIVVRAEQKATVAHHQALLQTATTKLLEEFEAIIGNFEMVLDGENMSWNEMRVQAAKQARNDLKRKQRKRLTELKGQLPKKEG